MRRGLAVLWLVQKAPIHFFQQQKKAGSSVCAKLYGLMLTAVLLLRRVPNHFGCAVAPAGEDKGNPEYIRAWIIWLLQQHRVEAML